MEPIKSQLTTRISELKEVERLVPKAIQNHPPLEVMPSEEKPAQGKAPAATWHLMEKKEEVNIHEYYSASPTRRWEVNFGNNNDAFFLTDEEHKHFLEQVKKGAQIIQVGMLTLTNRFRFIVPVKNRR